MFIILASYFENARYEPRMTQGQKYRPNTSISLFEFGKLFPNPEAALSYLEQQRWQGEAFCSYCGSVNVSSLPRKSGFWQCNDCRKQFSVRTGTVFQSSKIPLDKWFYALYLMVTARKGISSMQLSKELGITQKSAWFMCHRIRYAMGSSKYDDLLKGVVECDETYIGGKEKNKHIDKRLWCGGGSVGKMTVFGAVERSEGGKVVSVVAEDNSMKTLQRLVRSFVEKGSIVSTDELKSYRGLGRLGYQHYAVSHKAKEYKNGIASSNTVESVWAVLKRGYCGTFHKMSGKHLQSYVDEFDFRWNGGNSRFPTMDRIDSLLNGCFAGRLPYKSLVGIDGVGV